MEAGVSIEGYLIVDFVPTSENLSKWLFDIVNSKMSQIGVKVSRIDWFETPKSRSSYIG
jgi:6-pyruvoyltetrahydropterin/6-carboxytetrahydropterin synthase